MYADSYNTCLTYTPSHAWRSQHLLKCMHTFLEKCICTRACAPVQRCRNFSVIKAIENLSWVLREHCATRPAAVSTKSVARRCSLMKSVQIQASSWRSRRCGVAQASSDHPRWCRPLPACLWSHFKHGHGAHQSQKSVFAIFHASFLYISCIPDTSIYIPNTCVCIYPGHT